MGKKRVPKGTAKPLPLVRRRPPPPTQADADRQGLPLWVLQDAYTTLYGLPPTGAKAKPHFSPYYPSGGPPQMIYERVERPGVAGGRPTVGYDPVGPIGVSKTGPRPLDSSGSVRGE